MTKVRGFIVPKLFHKHHDGSIRYLELVVPSACHHDYDDGEHQEN